VPEVLVGYVRDQVARGWDVTVACPSDGWLAAAATETGATVVRWEAGRDPGPRVAGEVRRLRRVLLAARPDVVHLHSAKAGLAGRLAVRGAVPTLFQPHAWSFLAATGPQQRAALAWERFATRWTTRLVCVSDAERLLGERSGVRGPAVVVPNGVDLTRFRPYDAADRAAARDRLGLPDAPTVVCVGRLAPQKGQSDLLDAWSAVRAGLPGAALALVGDGPDRDALAARAAGEPGVLLAGARDDVPDWLAAADVVVVPSRWEGMALAPLEAMACGRSVVATDVTGIADSVVPEAGAVVPPGDVATLAAALLERLREPGQADAEGWAGRVHVEGHHDAVSSAAAVAELCAELAPAPPSPPAPTPPAAPRAAPAPPAA
jgi:glycosyltransferase involved in cell wall biosynthesis